MSKGGGKTETVTSTQKSEPWQPQQQPLQAGFDRATQLLGQPTSYSDTTLQGIDALRNRATQGSPVLSDAQSALSQILNQGIDIPDFKASQISAPGVGFGGVGSGQQVQAGTIDPALLEWGENYEDSPAFQYLDPIARGESLEINPFADEIYGRARDQIRADVGGVFSGAGRYGSGLHQDVYNDQLNELQAMIMGPIYESEKQRQMQAAGMIQGAYDTGQGRELTAAQSNQSAEMSSRIQNQAADLQAQGMNQSDATQRALANAQGELQASIQSAQMAMQAGLANQAAEMEAQARAQQMAIQEAQMQLQGIGMAPGLAAGDYMDIEALLKAGQLEDAQQQLPWDDLQRYMSIVGGGYGGTSSGSQTSPLYGDSKAKGALGGAASGASMGSAFGPWGTAIGAIGGGLLGAFG